MDRRKRAKHSRDPLPIGAIRIRRRGRGCGRTRMVKIGPRRWVNLARWWWEKNRGPVPAGMRVCHADGDMLNDDPTNYELMTPGDVVFLWHERNPDGSERNYEKLRAATAAFNREMAALRRQVSFLPTHWHPVDYARKEIVNRPCRKRWQVYGEQCRPRAANAGYVDSTALGWPEWMFEHACVLTVLAEASQGLDYAELTAAVAALRSRYGWPPLRTRERLYSVISELKRAEAVLSLPKPHGCRRHYRITSLWLTQRGPVSPFVPVRGAELAGEAFRGWRKVDAVQELAHVG